MQHQEFWDKILAEYKKIYLNITDNFYPSLESTGFQERNLTVNFSKAYEKIAREEFEEGTKKTVFSWFEFQFCKDNRKNDRHFDCLLVNTFRKEIVFVESKRFIGTGKKRSIEEDIDRINRYAKNKIRTESRFDGFRGYHVFGLILSDVWRNEEKRKDKKKKEFYQSFSDKKAFDEKGDYYILDIPDSDQKINGVEKEFYALLLFRWEASPKE